MAKIANARWYWCQSLPTDFSRQSVVLPPVSTPSPAFYRMREPSNFSNAQGRTGRSPSPPRAPESLIGTSCIIPPRRHHPLRKKTIARYGQHHIPEQAGTAEREGRLRQAQPAETGRCTIAGDETDRKFRQTRPDQDIVLLLLFQSDHRDTVTAFILIARRKRGHIRIAFQPLANRLP